MPDDNEIESFWGHRAESVLGETPGRFNPTGGQLINILTRLVLEADSPVHHCCNRLLHHINELPDPNLATYETIKEHFQEDPDSISMLDRVSYGNQYSPDLHCGHVWEFLRRTYTSTPTPNIRSVDRRISDYVLEYNREHHEYPQLSRMRGYFHNDMELQERIQELIVQVGGLDMPINLPSRATSPQMDGEDPAPTQQILDLRRLALLLSDIQGLVDSVEDSGQLDSTITELFDWVSARGREANLPERWWDNTLQDFEVNYRMRTSRLMGDQDFRDATAPDRRILSYFERYMSMTGHLPNEGEIRTYFMLQNDEAAITRLAEMAGNDFGGIDDVPQDPIPPRPLTEDFHTPSHNIADLELPERRSDEERDYDRRIHLRRLALLLEGMTQTCYHMSHPLNIGILRGLQSTLDTLGDATFNRYTDPNWRAQTLHDFRVEFLHQGAPGTFPRPIELYPSERRAYPPPNTPMTSTAPTPHRVADDNVVDE